MVTGEDILATILMDIGIGMDTPLIDMEDTTGDGGTDPTTGLIIDMATHMDTTVGLMEDTGLVFITNYKNTR